MNPFDLDATGLMVWGLVAHLVADWPLQNDWMAQNKSRRWPTDTPHWADARWWALVRHPAAYVHAGIHALTLSLVFGWVAAPLAVAHLLIDTRTPVVWWSSLMRQTQPANPPIIEVRQDPYVHLTNPPIYVAVDIGMEVRFWTDQVFHIACIAVAALVVA